MKSVYRIFALLIIAALVFACTPGVLAVNHPFADVPDGQWYSPYVAYVYENDLMSGTSETTFSPNATMTRAMVVTVLHRLAGKPIYGEIDKFTDVPYGTWYTGAVFWAVGSGITSGTSETTFSPNDKVTREQLVTFLYRYAEYLFVDITTTELGEYADLNDVAEYARTPFGWAVANGIVSGTDETHLSPKNYATRAQCAAVLARFDQWLSDKTSKRDIEPDPSLLAFTQEDVGKWVGRQDGYDLYVTEVEEGVDRYGLKYVKVVVTVRNGSGWVPPGFTLCECRYCREMPCPDGGEEKCSLYDEKLDPGVTCQRCGKPQGDGTNGTCISWPYASVNCPNCGEYVEQGTCHSCAV